MTQDRRIRLATTEDAAACAVIYAHYVRHTVITFETEPPSVADMAVRIATSNERHAWLVLEEAGAVVGYAYAGPFKPRAAYQWSCEVSVYLHPEHRGAGAGRALYDALLPMLRERGYRRAIAVVAQPNPASNRLHEKLGFTHTGTQPRVGWKHGAWHDVAWSQLDLVQDEDLVAPPAPPA
ncbi:N-acetyltransferase family protein [Microbacterium paludicola]|jgi:phosphinothricin acetyltransferase|uniref:N-acetyltransferase family protein n=1 Tax=Microbacterium paludicola TaxID=300019 RepID=A0A4Y9FZW3_9MICO|nr:GNAT family N-acetyltransferase [Microbacterium paludicola]MBF0815079.1 N-acetyltransferase [Microbacterium paludicola]TFU34352.1 N-acetyltransferase family protein [Microbacterium paludicola]